MNEAALALAYIALGAGCAAACWRWGVPLVGALWRRCTGRRSPATAWYQRGADRQVSPLETVPGAPDADFDEITVHLLADPRLARAARKVRP